MLCVDSRGVLTARVQELLMTLVTKKPRGGVLGLEKGTICGPTDAERWLSQREMAKKGGCPLIILYDKGVVRFFASNILYHITSVYIQICS